VTKLVFVLVLSGPLKGHKYFVKSDSPILIGRSDEANVRIAYDDFCSRKHALLYWEGNTCYLKDLESTNGTYLNNEKITGTKELHDGDIIGLGDTELLVSAKEMKEKGKASLEDDISYED